MLGAPSLVSAWENQRGTPVQTGRAADSIGFLKPTLNTTRMSLSKAQRPSVFLTERLTDPSRESRISSKVQLLILVSHPSAPGLLLIAVKHPASSKTRRAYLSQPGRTSVWQRPSVSTLASLRRSVLRGTQNFISKGFEDPAFFPSIPSQRSYICSRVYTLIAASE